MSKQAEQTGRSEKRGCYALSIAVGTLALLAMCVITLSTPVLGFVAGLLGFEWEVVEGFAYSWWPSCLCGGWALSLVLGSFFAIVGIMGFTRHKPHTWLERLQSRLQAKPVIPRTPAQAEEWWTEFTIQLAEAFLSLEQMSSLRTPDFFEPGADDVYRENTRVAAELLTKGLNSLHAAEERLRNLQAVWPEHKRALRILVSALAEYRGMLKGYSRMNMALDIASGGISPQELGQIALRSRRHAEKGDRLLRKGLSRLGRSMEIELPEASGSI